MHSRRGPRPAAVRPRLLSQLAERLGAALPAGAVPQAQIRGITHDSRQVRGGDVYVAVPGARVHGADFSTAAAQAGAVVVVTDPDGEQRAAAAGVPVLVVPDPRARMGPLAAWVYGDPAQGLDLLGVTGTNGKTTTTYFIEAGLRAAGRTTGLLGTIETRIGTERVPSARTTPEAPDLQALLAIMREQRVDAVVMEVSSHALALGRVDGAVFDVAAFLNLSEDHLDFHTDLEDYYRVKASLFTPERARRGIVNVDDSYGARLAAEATVPVTTVSPSGRNAADWTGGDHVAAPAPAIAGPAGGAGGGSSFTLRGPDGVELRAGVRLPGTYNVENAAVALVMLVVSGVPGEVAARGIASCDGVPGRMERIDAGQPFLAVVDYAHTPDAVALALAALRPAAAGQLLVVLGCGGDRDRHKRPHMGEVGARGADVLFVTDDNPRSEDPALIRAAMLAGAALVPPAERGEVVEIGERREAIAAAVRRAGPDDVVLVAGKGHEQGQEIGGSVLAFDDREVLAGALRQLRGHAAEAERR